MPASSKAPFGAKGRPSIQRKVVSSGAISPQRAPASIAMLHIVIRPAIDSARTASPAYSTAWPRAPSAPIFAMIARMKSLAPTPGAGLPAIVIRIRFGFFCQSVCVISTWATSEAPMPKA